MATNVNTREEAKEEIENLLYGTGAFTTDVSSDIAEEILKIVYGERR